MTNETSLFSELESRVRSYCRRWPTVFSKARGSHIYDELGRDYLDFFAGAGALNYGHNNPHLKEALLRYLQEDSIVHGMDMYTTAKREFLAILRHNILLPRGLDYKVQFPGPAGTTAVEAALKLARKYTGRRSVVSFTNAFHGMTLGALGLTPGSAHWPQACSADTVVMPYDQSPNDNSNALSPLERLLEEDSREVPAAVIVETVQGDGGLYAASPEWLQELGDLCRRYRVLLIVDDVQMGCGRTGPFFSFEDSGIRPDIVCLSKSLSGYGLPLALTLFRPELDVWEPGEHSGTFRGTNPAFVTATAALDFWEDERFEKDTLGKSKVVERAVREMAGGHVGLIEAVRGRGLAWGIAFREPSAAHEVSVGCFDRRLLVEVVGPRNEVVKLMPPLTITDEEIASGLRIVREVICHVRART